MGKETTDKQHEYQSNNRTTWRSLFLFMERRHLFILIPGLSLTAVSGAAKPVSTIFLGRIFDELAAFGRVPNHEDDLLSNVSKWCLALTILGAGATVVNSCFFILWLRYGETQARCARQKLFAGMLAKEMEWYDMRSDGVSSLLVRIET